MKTNKEFIEDIYKKAEEISKENKLKSKNNITKIASIAAVFVIVVLVGIINTSNTSHINKVAELTNSWKFRKFT